MFLMYTVDTQDGMYLTVLKTSYTLTLGELDFEDLNTTKFLIFMLFTTLITLILMNLLIAILSDAYELVTSEKKYYDGQTKIRRSLSYERLAMFILKQLGKRSEQTYYYLFASVPLSLEEDTNNEDEGMIGKILHAARVNQKEVNTRFDENQEGIKDARSKIDAIQEKVNAMQEESNKRFETLQGKVDKKMDQMQEDLSSTSAEVRNLEQKLIEAFSKLIEEKLAHVQVPRVNNLIDN